MKTVFIYFLQVIICSGILYSYYHVALRNKKFHQYNRYYLLAATVISILIPFINIPVYFSTIDQPSLFAQTLAIISSPGGKASAETTPGVTATTSSFFNRQNLSLIFYTLIGSLVFFRFAISLYRIKKLISKNVAEKVDHIYFVNTAEPGTPFSFFRWMFWNKKIELQSENGQQIFRHELFHIQQKHTWDIIFMEILTVVFWINPFYHLIKKELKTIHEFLADQFAVQENDKWNYAELLLRHVLQSPNSRLTNPFFHNQVKRRIAMITSSKKPGYQYLRKIMVLPIAALVITLFAFSYKARTHSNSIIIEGNVKGIPDGKVYLAEAHYWTVFLDSTVATNGHFTFKINAGPEFYPYLAKIEYPDRNAFLNLSVLMFEDSHSDGFYLEKGTTTITNSDKSPRKFPSGSTEIPVIVKAGKQNRVYSENVRIEFGWLDREPAKRNQQIEFYKKKIKQYPYSYYFFQGIFNNRGLYSKDELEDLISIFDRDVQSSKLGDMLKDYLANGPKPGDHLYAITDTVVETPKFELRDTVKPADIKYLIVIDGKVQDEKMTIKEIDRKIKIEDVTRMNILKNKPAIAKYGDKGKNGVIEIYTKKQGVVVEEPIKEKGVVVEETIRESNKPDPKEIRVTDKTYDDDNIIFEKAEIEPAFPGGSTAWRKFLEKNLNASIPLDHKAPPGTYTAWIQFVIDKEGNISDPKALTKLGYGMEEEAIRVVKLSDKWVPAIQNGHKVRAYKRQPINFVVAR